MASVSPPSQRRKGTESLSGGPGDKPGLRFMVLALSLPSDNPREGCKSWGGLGTNRGLWPG